jgi:hypothetical protein
MVPANAHAIRAGSEGDRLAYWRGQKRPTSGAPLLVTVRRAGSCMIPAQPSVLDLASLTDSPRGAAYGAPTYLQRTA